MNLVTTLVNTLEGLLKPDNLNNKADQVRRRGGHHSALLCIDCSCSCGSASNMQPYF